MRSAGALTALDDLSARGVVSRASSAPLARHRMLEVAPALRSVLPRGGLQRGEVVACAGVAAVSMAMAVAAGPSQEGSWVAWAGVPGVNAAALHQMGVALDRTLWVGGAEGGADWSDALGGDVLAALVDGVDLIVVGPETRTVRPATARRVIARLQARGAVMLAIDQPVFGADVRLDTAGSVWEGLGAGHGLARERSVEVAVSGRRAARSERHACRLPGESGAVDVVSRGPMAGLARGRGAC